MQLITTSEALTAFRDRLRGVDSVTVDTEFLREKSYWAQLCLVQVAGPDEAAAIDPLAAGIDLRPLFDLMADPSVVKVFHAARQDVEIFWRLTGQVPTPLFDTQVAAMVCGFGESVSYEILVARLAGARVDKSSRVTDWSKRPLSKDQLAYALADVTHLRTVYAKLKRRLDRTGRASWLEEEMARLTDPATYRIEPEEAWRRIKVRSGKPQMLAILKAVAAWREREAQSRDIPRGWVARDEALIEVAARPPQVQEDLARVRGLSRPFAESRLGGELFDAVQRGKEAPPPVAGVIENGAPPPGAAAVVELLRVLLRMKSDEHGVAAKLLASAADLDAIAADDAADIPALSGWRRSIFGDEALAVKRGLRALAVRSGRVELIPLDDAGSDHAEDDPATIGGSSFKST